MTTISRLPPILLTIILTFFVIFITTVHTKMDPYELDEIEKANRRYNDYVGDDDDDYDDDDMDGDGANLRHGHGGHKPKGHKHEPIKTFCYHCKDSIRCKEFTEQTKQRQNKSLRKCDGEDVDRCVIIRDIKKQVVLRKCLSEAAERHMYSTIGCKKNKTHEICTCLGSACNEGSNLWGWSTITRLGLILASGLLYLRIA